MNDAEKHKNHLETLRAALVAVLAFDGRHGLYVATEAFDASERAAVLVGETAIKDAQDEWRKDLAERARREGGRA